MDGASYFSEVRLANNLTLAEVQNGSKKIHDRHILKEFLEYTHIKKGLLDAYNADYPLIDARELLPSFEINFLEYKFLPCFSMVVFNRPLEYQEEVFQFDLMHSLIEAVPEKTPVKPRRLTSREKLLKENTDRFLPHLTKEFRADFKQKFSQQDLTSLSCYEDLLTYIFHMDRAHVIARDNTDEFRLLGCYASFPSDLDCELKAFGRRLGKFKAKDHTSYEKNRTFVYQFLMEQYGFPISAERRTSSALFARKLSRLKESYLIKVLGSSDRVITSLNGFDQKMFPVVEKAALVPVPSDLQEMHGYLSDQGFYVDPGRRVVIVKVTYMQHKYNRNNVQEDRALSVIKQEIIHPRHGERAFFNIIKDTKSFIVTLNDIIRGEYMGRISYRQEGVVASTKNHDDRLKFLYAWLTKNQRRFTSYSREFFEEMKKILNNYIMNPDYKLYFRKYPELHREVLAKIAYLQQSHHVQQLEKLARRRPPFNRRLTQERFLALVLEFIEDNYDEILHYYDDLFEKCHNIISLITSQPYLKSVGQDEEPPQHPYKRTLWMMLNRLKCLQENLVRDRGRIKNADEEGSFTRLLLRERIIKS
jgi:hypothetical protein